MSAIMQRLTPLFRDVLNDDRVVITPESNAQSMGPAYDSLAHINIISAIEQEFDIRFEFSEIVELDTVGDMIALIARKTTVAA
jgi:acyl carrier protein